MRVLWGMGRHETRLRGKGMEEHLDIKLATKQVADAFEVKPVTVSSWVKAKRLRGTMPRNARRTGRRFTLRELLLFARAADDEGASEEQLNAYWERNKDELLRTQDTGVSGTNVLGC